MKLGGLQMNLSDLKRPVKIWDVENKILLHSVGSLLEAAEITGYTSSTILAAIKRRGKSRSAKNKLNKVLAFR